MKFPAIIKHRRFQATIYAESEKYPYYRLAYRAAGKRIVRSFATYSEAKTEAETKVRELATGNQGVALSAKEVADALAIRDALASFKQSTGHRLTAVQAVTGCLDAVKLLPAGHNLADSVRGYAFAYKWRPANWPATRKPFTEFCKMVKVERPEGKKVEWRDPKGGQKHFIWNVLSDCGSCSSDRRRVDNLRGRDRCDQLGASRLRGGERAGWCQIHGLD